MSGVHFDIRIFCMFLQNDDIYIFESVVIYTTNSAVMIPYNVVEFGHYSFR